MKNVKGSEWTHVQNWEGNEKDEEKDEQNAFSKYHYSNQFLSVGWLISYS